VSLKKLIFFVTSGPANPSQATRAFRFAKTAHAEGLPAEVRLAGEAVLFARTQEFAALPSDSPLREHMQAVMDTPEIKVTLCPVSAQRHVLTKEHLVHPRFEFKYLAKVLREVSEGSAEFIYLG
jgi:sulfur relay (sulfurtransferase) complex TusBCD TusD component (DsrE family)